jgi:hypothetical protein
MGSDAVKPGRLEAGGLTLVSSAYHDERRLPMPGLLMSFWIGFLTPPQRRPRRQPEISVVSRNGRRVA